MPTYPVINTKTGEKQELLMSMKKYDEWRKENPDWDKDWSKGCASQSREFRWTGEANSSGWNEVIPMKNVKSGWDKQMEKLGLPSSVYTDPAKNNKIKLIKIDKYQSQETEDDIRINCDITIKKKGVNDLMMIKINFHCPMFRFIS